ncbi:hypothetical protein G6F70_007913 [Rhizopus microsporus]|nr:hypothetical protein G6F71_002050 [Rhizopus microsporus]KAG1195855.1 hypothetical protein G6F70_007913 [Rhizopus microsporus]KAG1207927.1 hypothetical protein G6F69_007643 [Rhizopus microsporus]KAG1236397.1 hypothetical protein G6F67_002000 [Rhizopus microsporus]KAG1268284.1 hypothetical protein G6F68_001253 [Rhizopus microsporus]
MLQLTKLPTMTERVHILQAQFLLRSLSLPDDTLLACLLPHIRLSKGHSHCLDKRLLKKLRLQYLQDNLEQRRAARNSGLLSLRRPKISLDPILWLPMSRIDRSRCVRWRLGWLSGYKTVPCARHQSELFTKQHAIHCLNIHRRLQILETTTDPLSFLLNRLPNSKPRSRQLPAAPRPDQSNTMFVINYKMGAFPSSEYNPYDYYYRQNYGYSNGYDYYHRYYSPYYPAASSSSSMANNYYQYYPYGAPTSYNYGTPAYYGIPYSTNMYGTSYPYGYGSYYPTSYPQRTYF